MDIDYEISERITGLEEQIAELRQLAGESRSSYEELKQSQNSTYEIISELIEKMESDLQDELRDNLPECKYKIVLDDLKIELYDLITKNSLLSKTVEEGIRRLSAVEKDLEELREMKSSSGCSCHCGQGGCSSDDKDVISAIVSFNDKLIEKLDEITACVIEYTFLLRAYDKLRERLPEEE